MIERLVDLIRKGQFEEALGLQDSDSFQQENSFLFGYALYRLDRFDECIQALAHVPALEKSTVKCYSLKAQALYKLGRYKESAALYAKLMVVCPERMLEWSTNHSASLAMTCSDFEIKEKVCDVLIPLFRSIFKFPSRTMSLSSIRPLV